MILELPECRRCCCCLPLRRGILVFAYINLAVTGLITFLQIMIWNYFNNTSVFTATLAMYRGVVMEAQLGVMCLLYLLDMIFTIVLIVGVHTKRPRLMRVYYYYQLTTMIASFVVVVISYCDAKRFDIWDIAVSELAIAFIGFVVQIYLLLLIRSELNKGRYQEGRSSFINNAVEVFVEPPLRRQWSVL